MAIKKPLIVLGAFVAGLVACFGTVMLVTGQTSSPIRPAAAAIGGPFHLTDQNGKPLLEACPGQDTRVTEIIRLFIEYARAHPDKLKLSAAAASRTWKTACLGWRLDRCS